MRIMAVDYGDVRTGVSVSDASATLAGESWVIIRKRNSSEEIIAEQIFEQAVSREVVKIVVGYPRNMDGSLGNRAQKSERLSEMLRSLGDIDVVLWDERLTTISANRILSDAGKSGKKRKNIVDAVAASLILQSYLDSKRC